MFTKRGFAVNARVSGLGGKKLERIVNKKSPRRPCTIGTASSAWRRRWKKQRAEKTASGP